MQRKDLKERNVRACESIDSQRVTQGRDNGPGKGKSKWITDVVDLHSDLVAVVGLLILLLYATAPVLGALSNVCVVCHDHQNEFFEAQDLRANAPHEPGHKREREHSTRRTM
jgi:hypothetical protein